MFGFDVTTWMLVFLRVGAMMALFPIFSMPSIPVQVRVGFAAWFSFLIAPFLPGLAVQPTDWAELIFLMTKEVGIGVILAFVSRIVFYILEFAGNVVSVELGMNWGATLNPMSNSRSEAPGLVLFYLGAVIFLTLNFHHWLLGALQRSFVLLPIGSSLHLNTQLLGEIMRQTSLLFLVGLLMSAPVIAVAFLINLVFSVIGRAIPQMNVFVESFSFRALAGLAVFGLTLNLMAQHAVNYLRRLPEDLLLVAQLLGTG